MKAYFGVGKAKTGCEQILRLGEVCLYQYNAIDDLWDVRIGDGKHSVKDLPRLANYDIYQRVTELEKKIQELQSKINHETM